MTPEEEQRWLDFAERFATACEEMARAWAEVTVSLAAFGAASVEPPLPWWQRLWRRLWGWPGWRPVYV